MRNLLLPLLLLVWFIPNLHAQTSYENNLNEEYVLKLSFNLIDKFYLNGNITLFLKSYLDVNNAEEFEKVFPDFTSPQNIAIRAKVFNGLIETIGTDMDFLYGNLLGITNNPATAKYWTAYLLEYYPFDEQSKNVEDEKNKSTINKIEPLIEKLDQIRYQEIWDIIGVENNDKGTFEITKYEDWSCKIILSIQNKKYISYECYEEGVAKLKDLNGDVMEITFLMPEMLDLMIDIKGNETRFDYSSSY